MSNEHDLSGDADNLEGIRIIGSDDTEPEPRPVVRLPRQDNVRRPKPDADPNALGRVPVVRSSQQPGESDDDLEAWSTLLAESIDTSAALDAPVPSASRTEQVVTTDQPPEVDLREADLVSIRNAQPDPQPDPDPDPRDTVEQFFDPDEDPEAHVRPVFDTNRNRRSTPRKEAGGGRNLGVAVGVGIGLVLLAAVALWSGPPATMVLIAVILGLCAVEFFTAVREAEFNPATLLGMVGAVALPLAVYWRGSEAYPVICFLSVVAGFAWYLFGVARERPLHNMGVTLLGILYIGGLGSFAARILTLDSRPISTLLSVIALVVANDVAAYFTGKGIGRTQLSWVSPGKSWEGTIGGAAVTMLVSILLVGFGEVGIFGSGDMIHAILLGLIVPVAAICGDLSESLLKRDLGIKDISDLLPGHGGFLDRFDAMLFALPTAFYLAVVLDLARGF